VLFTDGEDNLSWLGAGEVRRVLLESNVLVEVVASVPPDPPVPVVGRATPMPAPEPAHVRTLRRLAEATGGQPGRATPERLAAAFGAILEAMRTRYVLRFERVPPAGNARDRRAARAPERQGALPSRLLRRPASR
jgi:hypothetical protein